MDSVNIVSVIIVIMLNHTLQAELLSMREEDLRVRKELMNAGQLGGSYVPRMEAVHIKNPARLRHILAEYGWPAEDIAGKDGAEAAWLIVQHAIGEPDFQRSMLILLRECAASSRIPAWHAAYLEDRIAMYEGRPQRFGSQWTDDPRHGRIRPWNLADCEHVNELRASLGLGPMPPILEPGPDLPQTRAEGYRRKRALGGKPSWRAKDGEVSTPDFPDTTSQVLTTGEFLLYSEYS